MSVITAEDTGLDIEDDAEIDYEDAMDDDEIAKQLSGDIRTRGAGGRQQHQQQGRGGGVAAAANFQQPQRSQLQRSVTSDSMGMTAEMEDFLADSEEEESNYGTAAQGGYGRSQTMGKQGGGGGASSYLRSYTTRR